MCLAGAHFDATRDLALRTLEYYSSSSPSGVSGIGGGVGGRNKVTPPIVPESEVCLSDRRFLFTRSFYLSYL